MSAPSLSRRSVTRPLRDDPSRAIALAGVLAIVGAYALVLYWAATVVGGRGRIVALIALSLAAATVLRDVDEETALRASAAAVAVGGGWYLLVVLDTLNPFLIAWVVLTDTFTLATGSSILFIQGVDLWAQAVVPAPTFLAWYLALRRRYVLAVAAGGVLLLFLSLTGDAPSTIALLGVLGGVATVGAGELSRREGTADRVDALAVLLAVLAVVAMTVSVVPAAGAGGGGGGGAEGPVADDAASEAEGESEDDGPVELESTVTTDDQMRISGEADLTPEPRFVVTADEPMRWRTQVYDRYTGDGWLRTGGVGGDDGALRAPPGETETIEQRYELRSSVAALPAGATPVEVSADEDIVGSVTEQGTLVPARALSEGDRYAVRSERPVADEETLDDAGTDYPAGIADRYTELPASTPDRVGELTAEVTADADTPYRKAVVVEQYLEETKEYSLEVPEPEGQVADQFLFEMDRGYCVYYATTMAVMLRSQGVPARVAVGYNTGERVGDGQWVVRGSDAHAWVEVYFPEVGWVEFDPTPAADWERARVGAIQSARADGEVDPDTPETLNASRDDGGSEFNGTNGTAGNASFNGTAGTGDIGIDARFEDRAVGADWAPTRFEDPREFQPNSSATTSTSVPQVREREPRLALLAIVFAGAVAGVARTGVGRRTIRPIRASVQRRRDPESDLERAVERLELLLAEEHRERLPDETDREYLDRLPDVDPRVEEVYDLRERARYAGEVDPELADRAVSLVDDLARERAPLVRRFVR